MKILVTLLLILIVVVSLVPILLQDPGYVLLSYADLSVETTLTFLVLAVFAGLGSIAIIYWLLKLTLGFPDLMYQRGQRRFAKRAQENFYQGLTELAEGHWIRAEKLLVSSSEANEDHLLAYLGAARAAQYQGEHERRDHYLKLAHGSSGNAELATGLTQAELQIEQGQYERALATVNHLYELDEKNSRIMEMLMKLYLELGEWDRLKQRLPEFWQLGIIDDTRAAQLELEVALQLLRITAKQGDAAKLLSEWNALSANMRSAGPVISEYAMQLMALGDHDNAEHILRDAISQHWSKELVDIYGRVNSSDNKKQLEFAESWTGERIQDAAVQLSLGRIFLHNNERDKARRHLETSIELGPSAEAFYELGALLQQIEDRDAALDCLHTGLALAIKP